MEVTKIIFTKVSDFRQLASHKLASFSDLRFPGTVRAKPMDFLPKVERGLEGLSLPFYICLYLNLCFLLLRVKNLGTDFNLWAQRDISVRTRIPKSNLDNYGIAYHLQQNCFTIRYRTKQNIQSMYCGMRDDVCFHQCKKLLTDQKKLNKEREGK